MSKQKKPAPAKTKKPHPWRAFSPPVKVKGERIIPKNARMGVRA